MSKVGVTQVARYSSSVHPETIVWILHDIQFGYWLPETRPPRSGLKFSLRIVERSIATDASIQTRSMVIDVFATTGSLRICLPRNLVRCIRQLFAPVRIAFGNPRQLLIAETLSGRR